MQCQVQDLYVHLLMHDLLGYGQPNLSKQINKLKFDQCQVSHTYDDSPYYVEER
jgi:hypothetical protein